MTLYLFNTSIMPTPGFTYTLRKISLRQAKEICNKNTPISAIGHQATAEILSILLDIPVNVNRIEASVVDGDKAVVLKMRGRPPEGKILSLQEMEEIGYDLLLMEVRYIDQEKLPSEKWLSSAVYLYGPGTLRVPAWPGYDGFAKFSYIGEHGSVEGDIIGDPQFLDRNFGSGFAGGHSEILDTAEKMGVPVTLL